MGFVPGLLGIGGSKGGSFSASSAPLLQGVNTDQTNQAYNQSQVGLGQQQDFLRALQAQNGIGNQQSVFDQQQALAGQLQGLANGTGPNPALQQLQNTTGQNVATQAALMAGQRGSGANAGLLARQAAMQGAGLQQQAVGQGAALSAQQQIAGMQALQQQQGMLGNLASSQVAQQGNALTGYNQAAQSEQQNLLGGLSNYNNAQVGSTSSQNSANAGIQGQVAKGQQDLLGGVFKGAGAIFGMASGGMVPKYADGGSVGMQSNVGRFLYNSAPSQSLDPMNTSAPVHIPQFEDTNLSPSKMFSAPSSLSTSAGMDASSGMGDTIAMGATGGMLKRGGAVPGKASIRGDSLKNDTVPAMLSPGEVVIPRHVMQSTDPVSNAAKFVQAILAKNGPGRRK